MVLSWTLSILLSTKEIKYFCQMVKLIFVCCVNIKYVVFEKLYKNPPIIKKYPKIRKTGQIYE
jgi:hypothetical protein